MSENTAPSRAARPVTLLTLGVLLIALAGVFLVGLRLNQDPDPATTGVVTHGTGSINAKPDQLKFSVSVRNKAATTAIAMAKSTKGVKAVVAALKKAGVKADDIQTTSISIEPSYDYSHNKETIDGYVSSSSLRVLVRKLADGGKVISAAASAAGNTATVQNVSMSIGKKADLISQARDKAVKNSKKAARALAEAAGRSVDELVYVEEVSSDTPSYPTDGLYEAMDSGSAAAMPAMASVPISAGQQKITVTVKVRWSLN
jgi:uncharacterized protein YggE